MLRCVRLAAGPARALRAVNVAVAARWQSSAPEAGRDTVLSMRTGLTKPEARPNVPASAYLYGFTEEELADAPEAVKRALSVQNGSDKDVLQYRIAKCVEYFGDFKRDTGNTRVQVATDTMKIEHLRAHIAARPKDQDARRSMQRLINHRRTMLRYLKRTDLEGYLACIKALGLPDNVQAPPKLNRKKIARKRH